MPAPRRAGRIVEIQTRSNPFFGSCGPEGAQGSLSGICAQTRSEWPEANAHVHERLWARAQPSAVFISRGRLCLPQ